MGSLSRAVPFRCQGKPPPNRGKGGSVVRAAAYNARDKLVIEQTGEREDYRRGHSECTFSGIFAPRDALDWLHVTKDTTREELTVIRSRLWNEVERVEDRVNSQFARSLEINLPYQLTQDQREQVVKDWVKNFVRKGMIADVNLHAPHDEGDERNHHGHILLTLRRLDGDGWAPTKEREWNSRALFQEWKVDLAERCAERLQREGFEVEAERWRHGYMTLPKQRAEALERGDLEYAEACNRTPERHLGPQIKGMERRGVESYVQEDRAREAAGAIAVQHEIEALKAERAAIEFEQRALREAVSLEKVSPAIDRPEAPMRETYAWDDALHAAAIQKEIQNRSFTEDKVVPVPVVRQEKPLYAAVGDIRLAYQLSEGGDQFREALAERGYCLVRADARDADRSLGEHLEAAAEDRFRQAFELGQYAVIDERGRVFTLGKTATGDSRAEVSAFLRQLDSEEVPSIGEAREEFAAARSLQSLLERHYDRKNARREDSPSDAQSRVVPHVVAATLEHAAAGVEKLLDMGALATESSLGALDGFIAPSSPTREEAYARARDRAWDIARAEIDFARYQRDEDYRRQLANQEREESERRRQDRYYQQQKGREGGREM